MNFTFHPVGGCGGGGGHAGVPGEGSDAGPKPGGGPKFVDDDAVSNPPKRASRKLLAGVISASDMVNFISRPPPGIGVVVTL